MRSRHKASDGRTDMRRRMIRETEAFLTQRIGRDRDRRHHGQTNRDMKTDPRQQAADRRTSVDPCPVASTKTGILVQVPNNEHGHLDDELLDRWAPSLSRLLQSPRRGDVLLDLSGVQSVSERFVKVYGWLRHQLERQGRVVSLQVNGACLEAPQPSELSSVLKVKCSQC